MTPPMTGPITGPRAVGTVTRDMTLPMLRPLAACMISVNISTIMMPPPDPWMTRKVIRLAAFHAEAASSDPSRNRPSEAIHRRLPPSTACSQPTAGITVARASR